MNLLYLSIVLNIVAVILVVFVNWKLERLRVNYLHYLKYHQGFLNEMAAIKQVPVNAVTDKISEEYDLMLIRKKGF